MKKLLNTICALALVVCLLFSLTACTDTGAGGGDEPAHVHDYIDHVCSCGDIEQYTEGLKYKETANGVTVIGFEEGVEVPYVVYIPQKVNGKKVIAIGGGAFENSTFRQIVLPEGIEAIYSDAFKNSMVGSITFPRSLKQIYPNAFDTPNLKSATFLNINGWFITRHAITSKPVVEGEAPLSLENATTNAINLTNCEVNNKGKPKPGAMFWTRFD